MQLQEVPIKTALNLLTIYGDTVEKHAKSSLSLKQKAIYTYLRMVLQPIWLLNVTHYQSMNDIKSTQQSNAEQFMPALKKLRGL